MSTDSETQQTNEPDGDQQPEPGTRQPIRRVRSGRMLAGVAQGLSQYFGIDANIIRIGFAVLAILGLVGNSFGFGGIPFYLAGIPLYLALWVLIPEEGQEHSIAARFLSSVQARSRS